ncbi:MAG: PadR family transcriptional regulator [Gudongella sp.]|jgi:DNA-binding PadR family transcriptional regulator|nr:PadR family transcriptional regulator [Gudongella sp.]
MIKGERQRQFPTTISTTSFVKLYILHLLNTKSYYGNRLIDEISRRLSGKWTPSPGMVYPLLNQMETEGYITGHWEEPTKRTIRVYRITDKGREHFNTIKSMNKSSFDDSLSIIKSVMKDIYNIKL